MVHHWILLAIFFCLTPARAQDERYYRQMLSGELPRFSEGFKETSAPKFNVLGPVYGLDLNDDKIEESIQPQKRDGADWIEIRGGNKAHLFEAKLFAMGSESSLYKIKLVSLSPKVKALILFLDEGFSAGKEFESMGRIFVISFEDNDLSTMKIAQGPHMFHEKESVRDMYYRRDYRVNVVDFNKDGVKEISVQFNHIQRIMQYLGKGEWKRY